METPLSGAAVLADRYVLEQVIGRGGMADVYRASDQALGRAVAVKVLRDVTATNAERARFTEEARTLARLSHSGLVTVLDAGTTAQQPFLVMELVDGPSLADCCSGQPLQPERVAAIGADLADALAYAHRSGIVHRDVKPANVLLAGDGRVRLTDFGIARLMSSSIRHTATGFTIGTAAYLSPEQVRGQDVTPATDVYSLGLVLLEALTGRPAYTGPPTEAALARLATPPAVPSHLPPRWRGLLTAMTALEAEDRPTAEQVQATLRDLPGKVDAAGTTRAFQTTSGTPPPGPERGTRLEQMRLTALWRWVVVSVVAVLALVLITVLIPAGDRRPTDPGVPDGVPDRFAEPLRDLHDAVYREAR